MSDLPFHIPLGRWCENANDHIAELEAEIKDLRRDDEMLRRALSNMGRWAVDDILDRYPVTKREGGEG